MDLTSVLFRNKKINTGKLASFGFEERGGRFYKDVPLCGGEMKLNLVCDQTGILKSEVIDGATGDFYTLHLVEGAQGEFVGRVKSEYENALKAVAENCCDEVSFRFRQTEEIIRFAKEKYGDEPEFLWADTPDCAVLRRKDSGKWYAAILTVRGDKFKHDPQKDEVIDIRANPEEIDRLADGVNYFRGYHMNKKHWLTIVLDGSVPTEEICRRLCLSYELACKAAKK